jgi:putative transposase
MSKVKKTSSLYETKKLKLAPSKQLDDLAMASGKLYSETLVTYWRILRKKGIFLSQYAMEKIHISPLLHAHTSDAIVGNFYSSIKSANERKKHGDKDAKFPRKRKRFFKLTWKSSGIRVKLGNLILSNGRGNEPLVIPWQFELPLQIEIGWRKTGGYELRATYQLAACVNNGEKVAAVDLGEIRTAAIFDGDTVTVYSGRLLRSKQRYLNKIKGELASKIDTAKKGSARRKKLIKTKRRICNNLNNQIKDILHKQSSHIISTLHQQGVQRIVIGDVRNIRKDKDQGAERNQQLHQALYGKIRWNLTYKAARKGMETVLQEESYTSKTCPCCGARNCPQKRLYKCKQCGFEYDRDGVGAINILAKYRGDFGTRVVGGMAPPVVGVKFIPHLQCRLSVLNSRTPCL